MNTGFAENMRVNGHKYQVDTPEDPKPLLRELPLPKMLSQPGSRVTTISPKKINRDEALEWVRRVLVRTRGRELVGNFNPPLVGELFWAQCSNWKTVAVENLEDVAQICTKFLDILKTNAPRMSSLAFVFLWSRMRSRPGTMALCKSSN